MNTIIIKTQREINLLPKRFNTLTKIHITGKIKTLNQTPINSYIIVSGSANIGSVYDSANIKYVYGSANIEYVSGSANIEYVSGSANIEYVSGSANIGSVYDSANIKYVSGNTTIRIYSSSVIINKASKMAVIINIDCKCKIKSKEKSVSIINNTTAIFDFNEFINRYSVKIKKESIILYKSVQDNLTDFHSGKIKYTINKKIYCPDWNDDTKQECGGGLHLSPSIHFCKTFNKGRYLECKVPLLTSDGKQNIITVTNPLYPHKIRCKELFVIKEVFDK